MLSGHLKTPPAISWLSTDLLDKPLLGERLDLAGLLCSSRRSNQGPARSSLSQRVPLKYHNKLLRPSLVRVQMSSAHVLPLYPVGIPTEYKGRDEHSRKLCRMLQSVIRYGMCPAPHCLYDMEHNGVVWYGMVRNGME